MMSLRQSQIAEKLLCSPAPHHYAGRRKPGLARLGMSTIQGCLRLSISHGLTKWNSQVQFFRYHPSVNDEALLAVKVLYKTHGGEDASYNVLLTHIICFAVETRTHHCCGASSHAVALYRINEAAACGMFRTDWRASAKAHAVKRACRV